MSSEINILSDTDREMEEPETRRRCCGLSFLCGRTGLFILMTGYALLGAVLFRAIEGGPDIYVPNHVQRSREECLKEMWQITERLNVLYEKNWTKLVTEQLKRFERSVLEAGKTEGKTYWTTSRWSFGGALLYSITLLTTVGYGRLSPRTTVGKVVAMLYALVGVPLMLILLSTLGSLLAGGAKKGYLKLCCKHNVSNQKPVIGYHRAPSSPSGKHSCRGSHDDTIQITTHNTALNTNYKIVHSHMEHHSEHQEPPKKALLATVRASHARGRCRQGQVRQLLAEAHMCPSHPHGTPSRCIAGPLPSSDVEEAEEPEESEHNMCTHDTPSRVPLIWRPPDAGAAGSDRTEESSPSVPASIVLLFFTSYVGVGAVALASTTGWNILDAIYFCFIALSTIGVGDKLPLSSDFNAQMQLLACCLYIFLGLVIVAMCFSLVHEELTNRCRQFAASLGLLRH